jgi:hypothetical protein
VTHYHTTYEMAFGHMVELVPRLLETVPRVKSIMPLRESPADLRTVKLSSEGRRGLPKLGSCLGEVMSSMIPLTPLQRPE